MGAASHRTPAPRERNGVRVNGKLGRGNLFRERERGGECFVWFQVDCEKKKKLLELLSFFLSLSHSLSLSVGFQCQWSVLGPTRRTSWLFSINRRSGRYFVEKSSQQTNNRRLAIANGFVCKKVVSVYELCCCCVTSELNWMPFRSLLCK